MSNDRNRASSAAPGLALTCVRRPLPAEPGFCRRPLAACLLIALGLGGSIEPCSAGTVIVNRCNDQDGIQYIGHSLRKAINVAQEGDTVDMGELVCSTITLERGELEIYQNNLTIRGPTNHPLTVDAHGASRVFHHTGTGVAEIDYLIATGGTTKFAIEANPIGGCVKSESSVLLRFSTVSGCFAGYSGGGIAANGNVGLIHSTITGNSAYNGFASGGGVYAKGSIIAASSAITNNHARFGAIGALQDVSLSYTLVGGNSTSGVVGNNVTLQSSTVELNTRGGIYASVATVNYSTVSSNVGVGVTTYVGFEINNSTISGNGPFGINAVLPKVADIRNSTIAFNTVTGVRAYGCAVDIGITSSIVAANNAASDVDDISLDQCAVNGNNNLIGRQNGSLVTDPRLAPLAFHGGAVKTLALLANSPAIDAGSNSAGFSNDARGAGFVRIAGAATDIGAYERQPSDDEVFSDGFG